MSIVFNTLEKTFDNVTLLIQFFVKIVLNLEIGFIRNANGCLLLFNESTNKGRRVGSVGKYFFSCYVYKQIDELCNRLNPFLSILRFGYFY